ncbi:MAG: hypothetical protein NTU58_01495 [Candidatus Nealsonbacteria bacterium]|nr:hypothetical protein [Candidatus Nealsonbacteria bacterium]
MSEEIKKISDSELVNKAERGYKDIAYAELIRRLIVALNNSSKSSEEYSKRNLILSVALFFIGYMQLITTIITSQISNFNKIALFTIIIISIYFVVNWLLKSEREIKL